ncbi:hypothetical protein D3C72_1594540 [compost metagenome]
MLDSLFRQRSHRPTKIAGLSALVFQQGRNLCIVLEVRSDCEVEVHVPAHVFGIFDPIFQPRLLRDLCKVVPKLMNMLVSDQLVAIVPVQPAYGVGDRNPVLPCKLAA